MSKKKKELLGLLIIPAIIVAIILIGRSNRQNSISKILENPTYSIAVVTRVEYIHKKGLYVDYYFEVQGDKWYGRKLYNSGNNFNLIIGKSFPVVFNSIEVSNNSILIIPQDFLDYKLPLPDSLQGIF
jgi:hypothetical protein